MQLILKRSAEHVNLALTLSYITPLHYAAESDFLDVVKTLLEHGADTRMCQSQTQSGYNALHLAIRSDVRTELVKLLVQSVKGHERQKLLETRIWGDAALHRAARKARNSTIQVLLDHGAPLEGRTTMNDDTPLTVAVRNGRTAAATYLLEQKASIEARDSYGETALMIAASQGLSRTVEMLISKGANVSTTSGDGSTPLHAAARNAEGNPEVYGHIIRMLLAKDANVNARNHKKQTPLDKAVNRTDDKTIALLRSYGAVLFKPNKDVRDKYEKMFDADPNASNVGSVLSVESLLSSSPSMPAPESKATEKSETILGKEDDEPLSEEPGEIGDKEDGVLSPPYTSDSKDFLATGVTEDSKTATS